MNELKLGERYGSLKHLALGKVPERGASKAFQKTLTFCDYHFCEFIINHVVVGQAVVGEEGGQLEGF